MAKVRNYSDTTNFLTKKSLRKKIVLTLAFRPKMLYLCMQEQNFPKILKTTDFCQIVNETNIKLLSLIMRS